MEKERVALIVTNVSETPRRRYLCTPGYRRGDARFRTLFKVGVSESLESILKKLEGNCLVLNISNASMKMDMAGGPIHFQEGFTNLFSPAIREELVGLAGVLELLKDREP